MPFPHTSANSMTVRLNSIERVCDLQAVRRWAGNSERWLGRFFDAAITDANINSVVLMGSAIRERGHRRSDLDLLVLYSGKRPSFDKPLEVDLRAHSTTGLEEKIAAGHEVLCWAIKYGIAILDKQQFWQELCATWTSHLPLPSAQQASERALKSLTMAKEMLAAGDDSAADDLVLASLTQFVRAKLIDRGVFPASRPELPRQLLSLPVDPSLGYLLEDAMFGDVEARDLIASLERSLRANQG